MYMAKTKDGKSAIYLSQDSQMEKYLGLGCNIFYREKEDAQEELIATPEDGFLVDRPTFPTQESSSI